jgi:Asp-tRNA(Asn)/Glu-tRNA(Gln) amidotransferase A subunit family amidase
LQQPALGTPRNWYNKLYYPGGSSSGAASTLGAGVVPIAVGTDAAGSLRVPAAYNGVYSLKPTFGRIEYKHSSVCVVGPMAGTASDLAIAYRIMAQPDPAGGTTSQFAPSLPPRRASAESKKYIGVCRPWVGQSIPFVLDTFNKAIEFLASKAGYETIDIDLPWLQQGQLSLSAMCLVEAAERAHARAEKPAHWLSLYNAPNRVLLSVGEQAGAEDYIKCGQLRELIMQHLASLWRRYPGMLVLSPMTPGVGWPVHPGDQKYGFSDGNVTITNMTYAWLANLAGCPAVSCPMGYGEPAQGEGKVPVGVQAMGEWGEEERLLLFAKDAERWLNEGSEGGRLRPKEWVDVLELARKASGANVQGKGGEESEGTTGGK